MPDIKVRQRAKLEDERPGSCVPSVSVVMSDGTHAPLSLPAALFVSFVSRSLSTTPRPPGSHAASACLAGTYFTHEAKGADDAADADTAIINAEGGQNNSEEKKEYFI